MCPCPCMYVGAEEVCDACRSVGSFIVVGQRVRCWMGYIRAGRRTSFSPPSIYLSIYLTNCYICVQKDIPFRSIRFDPQQVLFAVVYIWVWMGEDINHVSYILAHSSFVKKFLVNKYHKLRYPTHTPSNSMPLIWPFSAISTPSLCPCTIVLTPFFAPNPNQK